MTGYFKTYIADGREWLKYGEDEIGGWQKAKKDFPFPESLLKLLYLNIWSLEPLTKKIEKALLNLFQTKEEGPTPSSKCSVACFAIGLIKLLTMFLPDYSAKGYLLSNLSNAPYASASPCSTALRSQ